MIDWTVEWPKIQAEAMARGVDPRFVRAIREQENGAPGREFGVLSVPAPTYTDQLAIAAQSVAHRLYDYTLNPTRPAVFTFGTRGICYSDAFIAYFGSIWAPLRVANDPTDLNANWIPNVKKFYSALT